RPGRLWCPCRGCLWLRGCRRSGRARSRLSATESNPSRLRLSLAVRRKRTYALLLVVRNATLLTTAAPKYPQRGPDAVLELSARKADRGEVLRRMRRASGSHMPELREPGFDHGKVLSRVCAPAACAG